MLAEAKALGMDRVLVMCEAGNIASAKTIESQGGVPAKPNVADESALRYWIRL
jgi:predicted acetyltransferase